MIASSKVADVARGAEDAYQGDAVWKRVVLTHVQLGELTAQRKHKPSFATPNATTTMTVYTQGIPSSVKSHGGFEHN
jgi:hypothetical protein